MPGPPGPMGLRGVGDTGAKVRFLKEAKILVFKKVLIDDFGKCVLFLSGTQEE